VKKPASATISCPNKSAPKADSKTGEGWHVYKADPFPTVEDIANDLKLCGIAGANPSLFYSFGGGYSNATKFQKANPHLNLKTLNDIMPNSFYNALGKFPNMGNEQPAQKAFIARMSQAFASVSKGEVYLVANEDANIYTTPRPDDKNPDARNVWYEYEFGELQRNDEVTAIYTVSSKTFAVDKSDAGSWVRSRTPYPGDAAAVYINADTVSPGYTCDPPTKKVTPRGNAKAASSSGCTSTFSTSTRSRTSTGSATTTETSNVSTTHSATSTKATSTKEMKTAHTTDAPSTTETPKETKTTAEPEKTTKAKESPKPKPKPKPKVPKGKHGL
jgi:hypothetical protein